MRSGSAEGVLLGGNLSMVVRLLGTPHLPDLTGEERRQLLAGLDARRRLVFRQRVLEGGLADWRRAAGSP